MDGGCGCSRLRYRLTSAPIFTQACHCTWCQRATGAAHALNAMIEAERVELLSGEPEMVLTPSASGKGQKIWRCPACRIAVWSNYAGSGERLRFIRVGTLDTPAALPPQMQIFTSTKLPWVRLNPDIPAVADYYDPKTVWPAASLERMRVVQGR